jgi:hypothetical protein
MSARHGTQHEHVDLWCAGKPPTEGTEAGSGHWGLWRHANHFQPYRTSRSTASLAAMLGEVLIHLDPRPLAPAVNSSGLVTAWMNASTSLLHFRRCSTASQNSRAVTYSSSNRSFSSQSIQCHNRILPAGTRVVGAKSQPKTTGPLSLRGVTHGQTSYRLRHVAGSSCDG